MDIATHYDLLIDENNDPFRDPPILQEYILILQLLKSRIDLVDKLFLGVHHGVPSGVGNIQLLGKVVFELLPHILQKLKMERTFLHAWCIDTLHQLGQLNPFKIEQETFIRLHFQRHDDFEGLHLQFHLAPVAEFGVFHPNQSGQKYHGGDHQQEACAHQRIDNPSVHSFEIQLQWKKHSAYVL